MYMCIGFYEVFVPPSPKFHDHDVGEWVDWSVNWTVRRAVPERGVKN